MSRTQGPLTSGPCFFGLLLKCGSWLPHKTGKFTIIANCGIGEYARQVRNISNILTGAYPSHSLSANDPGGFI